MEFEVVRVFEGALDGTPPVETSAYMQQVASLRRAISAASEVVDSGFDRIEYLEKALVRSQTSPGDLDTVWGYGSRGNVLRVGKELIQ